MIENQRPVPQVGKEAENLTSSEIAIDGKVISVGAEYSLMCEEGEFVGEVEQVSADEDRHTVMVKLREISFPEVAQFRDATFVYNTLSKRWTRLEQQRV